MEIAIAAFAIFVACLPGLLGAALFWKSISDEFDFIMIIVGIICLLFGLSLSLSLLPGALEYLLGFGGGA